MRAPWSEVVFCECFALLFLPRYSRGSVLYRRDGKGKAVVSTIPKVSASDLVSITVKATAQHV